MTETLFWEDFNRFSREPAAFSLCSNWLYKIKFSKKFAYYILNMKSSMISFLLEMIAITVRRFLSRSRLSRGFVSQSRRFAGPDPGSRQILGHPPIPAYTDLWELDNYLKMDRSLESPTATVPRISGVSLSVPLSVLCATKKFLSKFFWIWRMSAREFAFPRLNLVAERKFNPKLFTFFKIIYIFEHYLLRTHTILFNGPDAQIWPERSYNQTSWLQIWSKPDFFTTIWRL